MVAAQKILSLDARESEQFRNLVERQSLFSVAFQSDRFQRTTGQICADGGKPLGNFVGDVQRNFHDRKFSMRMVVGDDGHFLRGMPGWRMRNTRGTRLRCLNESLQPAASR